MDQETALQIGLQEAGRIAMEAAISELDTDGRPIVALYEPGSGKKTYQTIFGSVEVARQVYQHSRGGRTVVPLETKGRFLGSSNTPKFSKMVSWKYSQISPTGILFKSKAHPTLGSMQIPLPCHTRPVCMMAG